MSPVTAQRNSAPAAAVGGQNLRRPKVVVVVVVVAIVGLLLLMPFAKYLAKFSQSGNQPRDKSTKLQSLEQSAADGVRRGA